MNASERKLLLILVPAFLVLCVACGALAVHKNANSSDANGNNSGSSASGMAVQSQADVPAGITPGLAVHDGADAPAAEGETVYLNDDGFTLRSHVAMAINDPSDLDLWQKTLGARTIGRTPEEEATDSDNLSQFERPDDTYTQDRLVQMGRIVVLNCNTPAHVLSIENNVARVEIADGVNAGIIGFVSKYCLYRSNAGTGQIYKILVHAAPPIQRPDGSFYPMAGIDFPADAQHPRGSVIRDGSKPPSGPIPLEQTIAPPQVNREINRMQEMRDNGN